MKTEFSFISIFFRNEECEKAAKLFSHEIFLRTGNPAEFTADIKKANFIFETDETLDKDSFRLSLDNGVFTVSAKGIRGLIFGYGRFLRKTLYENGRITLIEDISGVYSPDKGIRGHQIGYRTTPNTYDAWDYEDYRRYYLDLMYMGCNTVEHIPYEGIKSRRNRLMKYDEQEFLVKATEMAQDYDLDVSLWYPNQREDTDSQAAERRKKLLETLDRVNVIFPPGGDPGDMHADDFIKRCKAIKLATKEVFPDIEMWPSAQAPHSIASWGEDFIEEMEKLPEEIDGIITGPNRAFPIDELRRRLPSKYQIRLYPDITHNVRCEYPVHFDRDDWHFALTTGLSRECTNPRPTEYRKIHRLTRRYVCGSVSYSEGITDDVNKFVWSDMDFDPDVELSDSLLDYARLFFYGADCQKIADAILRLELNWVCDPAENPTIDSTLIIFKELLADYPFLSELWRFNQLLFRAECDWVLRHRRIFENSLVEKAKKLILEGNCKEAKAVLSEDFGDEYKAIREDITRLAEVLFRQIGLQSSVDKYCADNWERGAVLDTIDLPVTDRAWLLNRFEYAATLPENEQCAFMQRAANRNKVDADEFYFSFAHHGLELTGVPMQDGEFYMNFQGDRPNVNNGSIPTCMLKVYDNYTFRCKTGGFKENTDYKLTVTYLGKPDPLIKHHTVKVNGTVIYDGAQFADETDEQFNREMLAEGFTSGCYTIPKELLVNGCIELEIGEKLAGVTLCEFRITKA